jgi:hypothetical protein
MGRADPLAPFIDHLGVFIGTLGSPVAIALVALLAFYAPERRLLYVAAAAAVGCLDALAGGLPDAPGELAADCLSGALAALVQAWLLWPVRGLAGRIRRLLRAGRGHADAILVRAVQARRGTGRGPDGPPPPPC